MNTSQERYADYLQSDYWKRVSDAVKAKAGYRCQVCNSPHDLQAHHRSYANRGRELEHLDDVTCLCRRCHGIFHSTLAPAAAPVPQSPPKPAKVAYAGPITRMEMEMSVVEPGEMMTLTKDDVRALRTEKKAFTLATVEALGLKWSELERGWTFRLIGTAIPRLQYLKALAGNRRGDANLEPHWKASGPMRGQMAGGS